MRHALLALFAAALGLGCATDTFPVRGQRVDFERWCLEPATVIERAPAGNGVYVEVKGFGRDPGSGEVYLLHSASYVGVLGWEECFTAADDCGLRAAESARGDLERCPG